MGLALGVSASNRSLFGFAKRHRPEDPKIQWEPDIALGYHARAGRMKGVRLVAKPRQLPSTEFPGAGGAGGARGRRNTAGRGQAGELAA